jgi:hypothetical protein
VVLIVTYTRTHFLEEKGGVMSLRDVLEELEIMGITDDRILLGVAYGCLFRELEAVRKDAEFYLNATTIEPSNDHTLKSP